MRAVAVMAPITTQLTYLTQRQSREPYNKVNILNTKTKSKSR